MKLAANVKITFKVLDIYLSLQNPYYLTQFSPYPLATGREEVNQTSDRDKASKRRRQGSSSSSSSGSSSDSSSRKKKKNKRRRRSRSRSKKSPESRRSLSPLSERAAAGGLNNPPISEALIDAAINAAQGLPGIASALQQNPPSALTSSLPVPIPSFLVSAYETDPQNSRQEVVTPDPATPVIPNVFSAPPPGYYGMPGYPTAQNTKGRRLRPSGAAVS